MKKKLQDTAITASLFFFLVCMFHLITAAIAAKPAPAADAIVNTYKGVKVFIECRPAAPYQVLGHVVMETDSVTTMLAFYQVQRLVQKCMHDYPGTQGVIVTYLTMHDATAVKFN